MRETLGNKEHASNLIVYNKSELIPDGPDDPRFSKKFEFMADCHEKAIRSGSIDLDCIASTIEDIHNEKKGIIEKIDKSPQKAFRDYIEIKNCGTFHYITSCFMETGGEEGFYIYEAKRDEDGRLTHEVIENKELSGPYQTATRNPGYINTFYRKAIEGAKDICFSSNFVGRDYVKKKLNAA